MRLPSLVETALLLCVICQSSTTLLGEERPGSLQKTPSLVTSSLMKIREAAKRGDSGAQCELGLAYLVMRDYVWAAIWFRRAARQGDVYAQYNLGLVYDLGEGVSRDEALAAIWYRKAARQGLAEAQARLGWMYHQGHGVPQNETRAVAWWRKAAKQGVAEAQYNLGTLYDQGHGVPQDNAQAYFWYDLAASSGRVGNLKQEDVDTLRDEVAKRLTPAELFQVQERAKKWFESHAPQSPDMP